MKHIFGLIIAVVGLLGFASCSDNDYKYQGKENVIQIVESNILFTAEASNGELKFSAPSAVTATANKDWCHASVNGNTLSINVDANKDYEGRMAIVTLSCGGSKQDVYVQQNGIIILFDYKTCTLDSIPSKGGNLVIERKSATDPVTCTSDAEWLKVTENENGYELSIAENKSKDARTASITFSAPAHENSAVYTVIQKGADYVAPVIEGEYSMTYFTKADESASTTIDAKITKSGKEANVYILDLSEINPGLTLPMTMDAENKQFVIANTQYLGMWNYEGTNYYANMLVYYTNGTSNYISYTQTAVYGIYLDYAINASDKYELTVYNSAPAIGSGRSSLGMQINLFKTADPIKDNRYGSIVNIVKPVLTHK